MSAIGTTSATHDRFLTPRLSTASCAAARRQATRTRADPKARVAITETPIAIGGR
jgi:hypothetical protein